MGSGGGGGDAVPSLQGAGSPSPLHFSLFKNTVFGTLGNDTTTDNDVKIRIITFKHNFRLTFSDSWRNCWQSTGVHKCGEIIHLVTITRLYGCVVEERIKLQNRYR